VEEGQNNATNMAQHHAAMQLQGAYIFLDIDGNNIIDEIRVKTFSSS
jgi:hypothetical protein